MTVRTVIRHPVLDDGALRALWSACSGERKPAVMIEALAAHVHARVDVTLVEPRV